MIISTTVVIYLCNCNGLFAFSTPLMMVWWKLVKVSKTPCIATNSIAEFFWQTFKTKKKCHCEKSADYAATKGPLSLWH